MTIRVNGGIINQQVLAGNLRYFKMVGPFAWTVSNGSVNLPISTSGGTPDVKTYFVVADKLPVPNSAAERAIAEISKKCTPVIIGLVGTNGSTTEVHFAVENNTMGWGSDTPDYSTPPANTAEDPAAAAAAIQVAVRALGNVTTYSTVGTADPTATPVTATRNLATVTVTEVPFRLA